MTVRHPAVAGMFYPARADVLRAQVAAHLQASAPLPTGAPPAGRLAALVVPHAGYVYSGPVAGVGYRLLPALRTRIARVLLLGPAHYVPVRGLALSGADRWQTPLGAVEVDTGGRQRLLTGPAAVPVRVDDDAHRPEHSLEVQLPFLQTVLPDVPVLPVLVGDVDDVAAAEALLPWWHDETCLTVVSTDLSHYEPDWSARDHDARTAAAICRADASAIADHDACGSRPLRVLLRLAASDGACVRLLDRRTSADTAGSPERVVGYGAFAVERAA